MFSARRLIGGLLACAVLTCTAAVGPAAEPAKPAPVKKLKLAPGQSAVYVTNMHCKTCAKKIARKLYTLKGVSRVSTNVKDNLAIITPQPKKRVPAKSMWSAVQSAGFQPVKLIGPEGTYAAHKKTKAPVKIAEAKPATPRR